jgi:hypothetical protein
VTSSILGGGLTGTSTLQVHDPSSIFPVFDTVIMSVVGESLGGSLIITRARASISNLATITVQPVARSANLGEAVSFTVAATANPSPAIQWQRRAAGSTVWANVLADGRYLGVTTSTLTVNNVTGAMQGDEFRAVLTNSAGEVFSDAAALSLSVARITNLSVLTSLASAGDAFTVGYVVGGPGTSGTKSVLVRAAGPSLVPLGVSGALEDPKLELFAGSTRTAENDDWGGTSVLRTVFSSVGAFAFASGASRDAAAVASASMGDNSVRVSAAGPGVGAVIAELYDSTPASAWTSTTPRLVNVSILKHIGAGLTAGFVIAGNRSQTVLIRAVGPTLALAPFNVDGVIGDPKLELFAGAAKIGENDDWGGASALNSAFARVGAFSLPPAAKDAGIVATLSPGNYSVQVSGVGGTGVGLVEIYEVP